MVGYIVFGPELGKQELAIAETKQEVLNEIKSSKDYAEKTAGWMGIEGAETDIGYFNPPEEKESKDARLDVLKYFITGLLANDMDIFLSSFNPETISKDLFQSEISDKTEVAKEMMNRISRNGQITDVNYRVEKGSLKTNERNKLSVTFTYSDKKKAKIKLDIIPFSDAHHDDKESIFVITTSTWDLIKDIEKSTN
ncbi:hypothetical protein [Neobacillus notoginsengisoli]|nr:hypothetical protein [Neobacillus notoginsengisoli]